MYVVLCFVCLFVWLCMWISCVDVVCGCRVWMSHVAVNFTSNAAQHLAVQSSVVWVSGLAKKCPIFV